MALSGTLKDFALPDIFQLIGMQRKTGRLTLDNERETVSVIFEQGMVVYADSTVRRLDDLLGNVLVRHGKIRKEVLEEALAKQKVSMQRLGFILTSQGYIERDDLKLALSEQVQQIVFRVFRWKTGDYHFEPLAEADYDRDNATPVSTDHILMEGIRRVDEWPIIEKRIPSLEFVFRPLVPIQQIKIVESEPEDEGGLGAMFEGVGGGDDGDSSSPSSEVALTPQEEKIYRVVDGKRSVAAIMEMTGLSDFDVCRTLFDFIDRNLVAPAGQDSTRARPHIGGAVKDGGANRLVGVVAVAALLLLSLVALAMTWRAPFRLPGMSSFFVEEAATVRQTEDVARMERILSAVRVYHLAFGSFPNTLDDLVNASPSLVSVTDLTGADGVPYRFVAEGDRVRLEAIGPAGDAYLSVTREVYPAEVTIPGPAASASAQP